ncbi:MAG: hypothetical protein OHK0039_27250 [Bacteroidia bacterium]
MKAALRPLSLLWLVLFATLSLTAAPMPRWERLGIRVVNYAIDHDEILVTAYEGFFTALQIKVKGAPIDLMRCVVHYRNGETQEINVRQLIPAGGQSRILDLPGNRRIITKVVFWYDTKNIARRRATVELWGRH